MTKQTSATMDELTNALKDYGVTIISVAISGTDLKKSLSYKDLGLDKDVERELASLGRKSVHSNKWPNLFRKNKEKVYNYLDTYGVRFGVGSWTGTWAIPNGLLKEVNGQLEAFKEERMEIKRAFLSVYNTELEEFIVRANSLRPGFGEAVRKNAYDKSYVDAQIGFEIHSQGDMVDSISVSAVQGLVRIVKEYEKGILDAAKADKKAPIITRFTRSKLEEMRDYCYRFTFLTSVLVKAAELIEETLECLPSSVVRGELYTEETSKVMTTFKLLHTPDQLDGISIKSVSVEVGAIDLFDDDEDQDEQAIENQTQGSDSTADTGVEDTHSESISTDAVSTDESDDFEDEDDEGYFFNQSAEIQQQDIDEVDLNVDEIYEDDDDDGISYF